MLAIPSWCRLCSCALPLLAAWLLAGCKLIDQTSFGGAPRAPAPSELASALAAPGTLPLLVLRPDDGVPDQAVLSQAVAAAEARNGAVRFRLTAVAPASGDLAAQQQALAATADAARQVLDDMGTLGIAPDRVDLEAQTDPHASRREVRLFAL